MNKVESVVSFISNYRDIMTFVITIIQLAKIIISVRKKKLRKESSFHLKTKCIDYKYNVREE